MNTAHECLPFELGRSFEPSMTTDLNEEANVVLIRIPPFNPVGIEPAGELFINVHGAKDFFRADSDDTNLELRAEVFEHVHEHALVPNIADEEMVQFIDDQHSGPELGEHDHNLVLLSGYLPSRLTRRVDGFQNICIEKRHVPSQKNEQLADCETESMGQFSNLQDELAYRGLPNEMFKMEPSRMIKAALRKHVPPVGLDWLAKFLHGGR